MKPSGKIERSISLGGWALVEGIDVCCDEADDEMAAGAMTKGGGGVLFVLQGWALMVREDSV